MELFGYVIGHKTVALFLSLKKYRHRFWVRERNLALLALKISPGTCSNSAITPLGHALGRHNKKLPHLANVADSLQWSNAYLNLNVSIWISGRKKPRG